MSFATTKLFMKYEDLTRYHDGEKIEVTDSEGKSVIFRHGTTVIEMQIPSTHIIEKVDYVSRGFVNGTFNKFIIQNKNIFRDESIDKFIDEEL